jgi:hypothetical protein
MSGVFELGSAPAFIANGSQFWFHIFLRFAQTRFHSEGLNTTACLAYVDPYDSVL